MYIHSQICYLFHWTTSFVVCFGFWGKTLYTPRSSVFHLTRRQTTEDKGQQRTEGRENVGVNLRPCKAYGPEGGLRQEVDREKKRGEAPLWISRYPVVGIGALRAPFMLFISLGFPLV
jgi:hypothetical protein